MGRCRGLRDHARRRGVQLADGATELGEGSWYLVAFRSIRRPDADEERLAAYDEFAHQEAATPPGFVHYLKGPAADDGSCLSFCLWQSRDQARAAAGRPAHVRAVGLLDEMYAQYRLEFLAVRRTADGTMTFEPTARRRSHGAAAPASVPALPSARRSPADRGTAGVDRVRRGRPSAGSSVDAGLRRRRPDGVRRQFRVTSAIAAADRGRRRGSPTWTIRASANAGVARDADGRADRDRGNSNVPRFDGPAGTAAASATPEAMSAAWPIVSWSRSTGRPPPSRGSRRPRRPRCRRAPRPSVRGRPATASPSWSRRPRSWIRGQRSTTAREPVGAGQPVGDHPDHQDDDEQARDGRADEDGAGDDAADVQDERATRRDRDADDEVDDPLHDDRPERRRPADPLPSPR